MARLNKTTVGTRVSSPVISTRSRSTTHEGGVAFDRDPKGELFMLGVNLFAGEDTFYESGKDRDKRFTSLVESIAVDDPAWTFGFLGWLRGTGNIRTASIMGAAAAVHARLNDSKSVAQDKAFADAGKQGWNRRLVDVVCQRADEPGEFLAAWTSLYGKPIPQPVKRGLSDAVTRLYNEYSFLKWDSPSNGWRFGDVIDMCHIAPARPYQKDLFGLAIASRHGNEFNHNLPMISFNKTFRKNIESNPEELLNPDGLKAAGFTWEDALSAAGNRVDKAELWESLIMSDSMGYMALLRNLRNFEQAGISKAATKRVIEILSDPAQVAKSRQFPFRFMSAYKAAQGAQWVNALEEALNYSVGNVPELPGKTLVLSDISASMSSRMSSKSEMSYAEAAGLFASAIALKNPGNVKFVGFADRTFVHPVSKGSSLLRLAQSFAQKSGSVGGGTQTVAALREHFDAGKFDRVMIITDMQAFHDYGYGWYGGKNNNAVQDVVGPKTWLYGFSIGGYKPSFIESGKGKHHELGGLTDATFKMIPLLEREKTSAWPWEQ